MAIVLHFDTNQAQVHPAFAALQQQLNQAQKTKGIELQVAHALWMQKGESFLPDFRATCEHNYRAGLDQADFASAAEQARSRINDWVARQTKARLQDILPPGSLDQATRLVLANAIYFKGKWARPFEPAETRLEPFYLSTNRQANVPLMHRFEQVPYMENSQLQAIELPYRGGELGMLVLLPRRVDTCSNLEDQLSVTLLSDTLHLMKPRPVDIFLPQFKMESSYKLNSALARMGMARAFAANADFSGINGAKNLFLSDVFHKAWVEVKEEGTEAAAATEVAVATNSVPAEYAPAVFRADHPFLFLIRDTRSGSVLFLGRFADPTK